MLKNIAEQFLLLIQNPEKRGYLIQDPYKSIGIIGAILMDLSLHNSIKAEYGLFKVIAKPDNLPAPHRDVLYTIESSPKLRKPKVWVSKLSKKSRSYIEQISTDLENRGIIRIEQRHFLFIKWIRTELTNPSDRWNLIKELRAIVFGSEPLTPESASLLGLVKACEMYKVICIDRSEVKECKFKLKNILANNIISSGVDEVIKEIQAAIILGIVASSAAASSSSN
jgi:hypothetical protein